MEDHLELALMAESTITDLLIVCFFKAISMVQIKVDSYKTTI